MGVLALVTLMCGLAAPAAAQSPTLTPGNGQIQVSWDAPSDPVGTGIDGDFPNYEVEYRPGTSGAWTSGARGSRRSATITGLANGQSYQVRVTAIGPGGRRNRFVYSIVSATPVAPNAAPAAPTLTPGNKRLGSVGGAGRQRRSDDVRYRRSGDAGGLPRDGRIPLNWGPPRSTGGAPITDYDVRYRRSGDVGWSDHPHIGTGRSTVITGLIRGQAYEVQLRAGNAVSPSIWSPSLKAIAVATPAAPTALTLTPDDGYIQVSWNAPSDNGGAAITGYQIRVLFFDPNDEIFDATEDFPPSALPAKLITSKIIGGFLTDLTNGVLYIVDVRAKNSVGYGPWSDSASGTSVAPPAAPAPAKPTVTATGRHLSVDLTWPKSSDATITKWQYRLSTTANGSDGWTDIGSSDEDTVAYTVTGLNNGQVCYFQVRAVNPSGDGVASDEVSTTPAPVPAKPDNFGAALRHQSVELTWDDPSDSTIRGIYAVGFFRAATAPMIAARGEFSTPAGAE